jgi:hypothetical protein
VEKLVRKRSLGRYRRKWEDNNKMDSSAGIYMAQDRDK